MYLFVSDATGNAIDVFTNNQQTSRITQLQEPQGMTTDPAGNLYVANTDAREVDVFVPPYPNTPAATILDHDGFPVDVAVSHRGVVAVINICNGSNCDLPSTVALYANASASSPCAKVSIFQTGLSGAFDAKGNLYVGGVSRFERGQIGVIAGGCRAKRFTALAPQQTVRVPNGIQIDKNGNIAVLDTLGDQVDVFAPPARHSMTLALLLIAGLGGAATPINFALNKESTALYVADAGGHDIEEYAYPAGGMPISVLQPRPSGLFEGIAIVPSVGNRPR